MKALILGANGQLGQELVKLLDSQEITYVGYGSKELDITDLVALRRVFEQEQPDFIFDAAAYTKVDAAEDEGREQNWAVNAQGTKNIAIVSKEIDATLMYVSTDYVFDGTDESTYTENAITNPKNEYGKAKLEGEKFIQENCDKYYIIRTSWVFGEFGNNFVFTMKNLAKNHDVLTVVDDQTGRPTWTYTLAQFMLFLAESKPSYGIYNLSNDGVATWYDFAREILKDVDVEVQPVDSSAFPQKAYRPRHSVMDLNKTKATGFEIPSWQEALAEFNESI